MVNQSTLFISHQSCQIFAVLIRQLKSAGIDAYVIGSDGFDDPSLDAIGSDDASILDKVFFATLAPSMPKVLL